jgi:5-carboxymethyl-2-hydroxymuconate isomerase
MRLARVSVGSLCDFALQSSTGEWVPFASVGIDAGTTAEAIDEIRSVRARVAAGRGEPVHDDTHLVCPIVAPSKMLAIGLNYMDHIRETNAKQPASPVVFAKYPNSLLDPFGEIVVDGDLTQKADYESELAVVIGTRTRRVSPDAALTSVFGYAVANDVSARDLQHSDSQFSRSKSLDTFCPIGPWITTADDVPDPQSLAIRSNVNGERRQASNTKEMIFSVAHLISYLSQTMTLEPGDVILTGTPHGVGFAMTPPRFLADGDVVRCEVEGLGAIENRVVAEVAKVG